MSKSAFTEWFEAQHGPRPGGRESDAELVEEVTKGKRAELALWVRREWDARRQSALYAWQAKGGEDNERYHAKT